MPASQEWRESNPKLTTYLPLELHEKIHAYAQERGFSSNSHTVKVILEEFFDAQSDDAFLADPAMQRVIRSLKNYASHVGYTVENGDENGAIAPPEGTWYTTKEAYEIACDRGYERSLSTFSRHLRKVLEDPDQLSKELQAFNLEFAVEYRKACDPRDKTVKWIAFKNNG